MSSADFGTKETQIYFPNCQIVVLFKLVQVVLLEKESDNPAPLSQPAIVGDKSMLGRTRNLYNPDCHYSLASDSFP